MKSKGMRRRLRILMVIVICFMGWAGMTLWGQAGQLNSKNKELNEIEAKHEVVQQQNEAYQQEINRLSDPEYIEQNIRKGLNLTKPDEILFIQTK